MSDAPVYPDPLRLTRPTAGQDQPATYWQATAGPAPADDGRLQDDLDCDVAVIGGGYTGLSAAYHLRRMGAGTVAVLEANRPGWGCSGRNGSFARPALGRVPYADWAQRWGSTTAKAMFREAQAALQSVRATIASADIACDAMPDGWLKIAHRRDKVAALETEAALLRSSFGLETEVLDADRLAAEHVRGGEAHAALRWPMSFAMHPMKLAYGLARAARAEGAAVYRDTPVIGLAKDDERHVLRTPGGRVRARSVVVATNGYTVEALFPRFRGRLLPVLSNIVVTQPLDDGELAAGNFVTSDCMSDTRTLLYYYRRLPDNRILMGGKGPVRGGAAAMARHRDALIRTVATKFPFVRNPRADYFWGGWVALTRDSIPHIGVADDDPTLHYALGYIGSGVSCSIHAGLRIAQRIAGTPVPMPSPLASDLPRYPFAAFRRLGQAAAMRWYAYRDERPS